MSEIDDHPPSRFSSEDFGRQSRHVVEVLAREVILLSFARSRSVARRPHASSRFSRGVETEFTPASVTSRRMNGMTVAGRSGGSVRANQLEPGCGIP